MTEKQSLSQKLIEIQSKLVAPKNQFNSFGKYKYRSCEDILESVKPLAHALGTYITITDEIINIGDRYYIKATATISDGKDSISTTAYAREALSKKGMDESQVTGAASSYARKYALNGLFCIDDTKDPDTGTGQKKTLKERIEDKLETESDNSDEAVFTDKRKGEYLEMKKWLVEMFGDRNAEKEAYLEFITKWKTKKDPPKEMPGVKKLNEFSALQIKWKYNTVKKEYEKFRKEGV